MGVQHKARIALLFSPSERDFFSHNLGIFTDITDSYESELFSASRFTALILSCRNLDHFLNLLDELKHSFSVIGLTETKITINHDTIIFEST